MSSSRITISGMARREQGIMTMINRREFTRLIGGCGACRAGAGPLSQRGNRQGQRQGRHRRRRRGRRHGGAHPEKRGAAARRDASSRRSRSTPPASTPTTISAAFARLPRCSTPMTGCASSASRSPSTPPLRRCRQKDRDARRRVDACLRPAGAVARHRLQVGGDRRLFARRPPRSCRMPGRPGRKRCC